MATRTRTRKIPQVPALTGYYVRPGFGTVTRTMAESQDHRCVDVADNPGGVNSFSSVKMIKEVSPITGKFQPKGNIWCEGQPVPLQMADYRYPGVSAPIAKFQSSDLSTLTNKLLARTNPNRPVVDLPVFLFELRDLPKMLKEAGDAIHWLRDRNRRPPTATGLARANLSYQFGWKPFLSDLAKLLKFQEAVERKRRELQNLFSGRGLRRNVKLESDREVIEFDSTLETQYVYLIARTRRHFRYQAWGSVQWDPLFVPPATSPTDWEIYRSAFGLDITLSTVWEALPWSWLVDWFSDMGDFLMAHRNTIPVRPSRVCIMRRYLTTAVFSTKVIDNGLQWGGATVQKDEKTRTPVSSFAAPTASLPFLTARQLSILGSLALTKGKSPR